MRRSGGFLSAKVWLCLLGFALVVQFGIWIWGGQRTLPVPSGPRLGAPFPDMRVGVPGHSIEQSLSDLLASAHGCSLLVVVSTGCVVCKRMRVTWPDRFRAWSESIGVSVRPIWLAEEGSESLKNFTNGYDLGSIDFAFSAGSSDQAFDQLGVIGTPTLYLLDPQAQMVVGVLGDRLPPLDIARAACQ